MFHKDYAERITPIWGRWFNIYLVGETGVICISLLFLKFIFSHSKCNTEMKKWNKIKEYCSWFPLCTSLQGRNTPDPAQPLLQPKPGKQILGPPQLHWISQWPLRPAMAPQPTASFLPSVCSCSPPEITQQPYSLGIWWESIVCPGAIGVLSLKLCAILF